MRLGKCRRARLDRPSYPSSSGGHLPTAESAPAGRCSRAIYFFARARGHRGCQLLTRGARPEVDAPGPLGSHASVLEVPQRHISGIRRSLGSRVQRRRHARLCVHHHRPARGWRRLGARTVVHRRARPRRARALDAPNLERERRRNHPPRRPLPRRSLGPRPATRGQRRPRAGADVVVARALISASVVDRPDHA